MPDYTPFIPANITVHLGPPDSNAPNVTLPFADYIKNVASSELFPTWPENALRANIYAIISFALNRIYNEWYPSRGYDFDITNTTQYDQAFVPNREIYQNISQIVDELFNSYLVRQGNVEPLFSSFCDGREVNCEGLSQWGSVELANQGLTPYEILQRFYGNDINIIMNAPVQEIEESFPGIALRNGTLGNEVSVIQNQLNRIAKNYPAIPLISSANGIFDRDTENAVRAFQEIFDLPVTGVVDKATWYRIKRIYVAVKRLSDLLSEGISYEEATTPFPAFLREGMQGDAVRVLQYYLDVLAYLNPDLRLTPVTGYYDEYTAESVRAFQSVYGLPVTGVVDAQTWRRIRTIYIELVQNLPENFYGNEAKLYPGYVLSEGMSGEDIINLQTYLSVIGQFYREIPQIPVTGYFDEATRDVVYTLQRLFRLPITGSVGPLTWNTIAKQYDFLVETENL